jgi:uncharacterized protein YbjT (DUF2867 family)
MRVGVAGAFGFIGRHLIQHLLDSSDHDIIAISRSPRISDDPRVSCVTADMYSLSETTLALAKCDIAVYMVHSMAPSSRLSQGHFSDYDYILADNFVRAAKLGGVKQIIYVGGIIPDAAKLSAHLQSRLEVEEVLRSQDIPLTVFRCGLVIGPNGSSFAIIVRLVERLPFMILPQWMRTLSNPIYVGDLIKLISASIDRPAKTHRIIDAGMDEAVCYKSLVIVTARILGKTPRLIDVPYVSPHLSKLWVRLVSGAPKALVYPLIDSVCYEMLKVSGRRAIPPEWGVRLAGLVESIKNTFEVPFEFTMPQLLTSIRDLSEVRSVQRILLPQGKNAEWVAELYIGWLPYFIMPFLRIVRTSFGCEYRLRVFGIVLLTLIKDWVHSTSSKQIFRVGSGLLVGQGGKGRFEFAESQDRTFLIVALHNFRPALPWWIYRLTQAVVHKIVMAQFAKKLGRSRV